jgi:hypothetical protein
VVTTYYQDPTVEVTSAAISVQDRRFALDDVEYVWHREAERLRGVRGGFAQRSLIKVGLAVGGGLIVFGIVYLVSGSFGQRSGALEVLAPLAAVVLLLVFAGPIVDTALHRLDSSYDTGSSVYEIWVRWHGRDLVLLRIADRLRFGQIYRSIERAMEQQPLP